MLIYRHLLTIALTWQSSCVTTITIKQHLKLALVLLGLMAGCQAGRVAGWLASRQTK